MAGTRVAMSHRTDEERPACPQIRNLLQAAAYVGRNHVHVSQDDVDPEILDIDARSHDYGRGLISRPPGLRHDLCDGGCHLRGREGGPRPHRPSRVLIGVDACHARSRSAVLEGADHVHSGSRCGDGPKLENHARLPQKVAPTEITPSEQPAKTCGYEPLLPAAATTTAP